MCVFFGGGACVFVWLVGLLCCLCVDCLFVCVCESL